MLKLEEVFKTNGVPTHTFVEPKEYPRLKVCLRSPGRGMVVEGPSGIGKTTAIERAIVDLQIDVPTKLTARRPGDVELIRLIPGSTGNGTVIIEDFHRLPADLREDVANHLKVLADEESTSDKVIVVGINKAGERLISFAPDLANRIDIVRFENNHDQKVLDLVEKGEAALNISINVKEEIVEKAGGSFYLAQMLCREVCLHENFTESSGDVRYLEVSLVEISARVWENLSLNFFERCKKLCTGTRFRPTGRAPYLHLLRWLAESNEWSLVVRDAIRDRPELAGSVRQIVEKGFFSELITADPDLQAVLHFDEHSTQLTVEDPQFLFFIRGIKWKDFALDLGFTAVKFDRAYDFALSFSGSDRVYAEDTAEFLRAQEFEVFYDFHEQHRIVAEDIEDYLRPIYQSEARYVVAFLGQDYPRKIWTNIESDAFRNRLADGEVIPILFDDSSPSIFDPSRKIGNLQIDRKANRADEVERVCKVLIRKMSETQDR